MTSEWRLTWRAALHQCATLGMTVIHPTLPQCLKHFTTDTASRASWLPHGWHSQKPASLNPGFKLHSY